MELKKYQRSVLNDVVLFARTYALTEDAATAYGIYLNAMGLQPGRDGLSPYHDELKGVPKVCVKVPTGGGKTFIGVNAIDILSDALPTPDDVVVWLVPRNEIIKQTLKNFRDPDHFLHQTLERDFAGRVSILDKADGLAGRGFNASTISDGLTLFVLSYASFKTTDKDGRKAYRENSNLLGLTELQRAAGTAVSVENADDTALITAIASTNPIVIVDESHHAGTALSLDMLRKLNPRFVLELTATPDPAHANVIAQAGARQLKREEMVKLPVVVYRRADKFAVVTDAVTLQRRLEAYAEADEKTTGRYIRPIVLFQAEKRGADDSETYLKLKQRLVDGGIPAEQIAVRTGDVDELGETDLMDRACPIRFVITVDALAEGWDCPFAYVLATVANKTSQVSIEQIVGRVLRQPYATRAEARCLNIAYVLTASADFDRTVTQVVDGLNGVGFSREDVVDGGGVAPSPAAETQMQLDINKPENEKGEADSPEPDISEYEFDFTQKDSPALNGNETTTGADSVEDILNESEELEGRFESDATSSASSLAGGLGSTNSHNFRMSEFAVPTASALAIPQFTIQVDGGLFTDDTRKPLDREDLLTGFKLSRCGIDKVHIDTTALSEMRAVDLLEDSDIFRIRQLQLQDRERMRELFSNMSEEDRKSSIVKMIFEATSPKFKNLYGEAAIKDFIARVINDMDSLQVDACFDSVGAVVHGISDAIKELADEYCEQQFQEDLNGDTVTLEPIYHLPDAFRQKSPMTSYAHSLYEAEDGKIDGTERAMADLLSNSDRIEWWHRVVERKEGEFCINGFIRHYPDFLALTTNGTLLAIETKGGHLDGVDSQRKLRLGTRWADMAGTGFKYYMVFDSGKHSEPNSYTMAEFNSKVLG